MMPLTASGTIDSHLELLGWLHWFWAGFNAVVGAAMAAFALAAVFAGTDSIGVNGTALASSVLAGAFGLVALAALIWAAAHAWCAHALGRRNPWGRVVALGLAVFDALLVPLGTLLAAYTGWVLLQEEGRRRFGLVM
jgi:hypothetical protein